MSDRHVLVVDTETTGFEDDDIVVEVAYWDLSTGERGEFVPPHDVAWVLGRAKTHPETAEALRINGYRERIQRQAQDVDGFGADRVAGLLHKNTLAGSTPSFDEPRLMRMFRRYGAYGVHVMLPKLHHRMADLSNLAAQEFGIPYSQLPGLHRVCELLGVENGAEHSAAGDVDATGRCLLALAERAASRREREPGLVSP